MITDSMVIFFDGFPYLRVVPQLECVIECGCQDVFPVGGKLDKGDGRVVVIYQGLQTLAWRWRVKSRNKCFDELEVR